MRIAPWLYSFLPPIIPPGRKEWQLCNVSGFGRLFLSRRCRGRGVCRIFRRLRQSVFIAPLVMLRHDAADILHSPFGRTIEKIVVDADRSAGVFHSRHFHRIPSLYRLVWSEFGIFITGHTDGCWQQLHGNLTPAHAYGCGAQCFAGVQCASIFDPAHASSPTSCHACFSALCKSLVCLAVVPSCGLATDFMAHRLYGSAQTGMYPSALYCAGGLPPGFLFQDAATSPEKRKSGKG